jgi:hypothetical protein
MDNSIFSGMPGYLILTRHPGNLIKHVDNVLRVFQNACIRFVPGINRFLHTPTDVSINRWLAAVGALAYGFSSFLFLILAAGHNTQAIALAYMAPMIGESGMLTGEMQ